MHVSRPAGASTAARAGLLAALVVWGCKGEGSEGSVNETNATAPPPRAAEGAQTRSSSLAPPPDIEPPLEESAGRLRSAKWLAAGGGSLPELNQVQIEQDLGLAAEVFRTGGPGFLLFAAGPNAPTVQVLAPAREQDPVLGALADLFAPRSGRDATYRATTLKVDGPATATTVSAALRDATSGGDTPLLVYLAGHGNRGEAPSDNTIELWAQSTLTVKDVAEVLDDARREVRLVMTTCYSGGFAELAFRGADPALGPATAPRCGLFATTWDLEAAGCDPNPERAAQEGYGLHFLNALRGRDRDGQPLEKDVLDLDRDGQISLLEAHTRVRLVSEASDVPTTTSERWLRETAPTEGPQKPIALPEEDAVVQTLARRLDLSDNPDDARVKLQRLEEQIEGVDHELQRLELEIDRSYREVTAELLARWPVLDDPWHPEFAATLSSSRDAIAAHLERSPAYAAYVKATTAIGAHAERIANLRAEAAWLERLARALETRELAARLHARGGAAWDHYARLLACERGGL